MPHRDGGPPPLSCVECRLGLDTLYGPTKLVAPNRIYTCRRGVQVIQPQKTFLREGDAPTQIFTLYSGWAFRFKQLADGRRQILSFLVPGDMILLEALCFNGHPLPYSVKSLTRVSLCVFDLNDMAALMQTSDEQHRRYAAAQLEHLTSLNRRLVDIGRRSALGRVAQLILELEGRMRARGLSQNGVFHFPVRQEYIADALGLTTVYVNRTLDRLRRRGIIDFNRERMEVLDFDHLHKTAEEE